MSKYWYLTAGKMKVFSLGLLILSVLAVNAHAGTILGSAGNFAVLGATPSVTNIGSTTLTGSLGVWPAASITGMGPGANQITVNGANATGNADVHIGDSVANTAQTDAGIAFGILAGLSPSSSTAGVVELGGQTLTSGVYNLGAALLDGVLTLNFAGASNQNIVFQIGSTLTTASGPGIASVVIEGANSTDNVFWQVGSSVQIGTYTSFVGNIIANTTVAMQTGATDACGSVISLTAAVTMDTNTISNTCAGGTGGGGGGGTVIGGGTGVPEGGSTLLYLCSFLLPLGAMRAFRFRRSI
jgi:type VI secretion system secreted protein VgrG